MDIYSMVEATWIFQPSKLYRKSTWKQSGFFDQRNSIKKITWKQSGFFDQRNFAEKRTWKRRRYFNQLNYTEKVRGNDVEIHRNLVFDIST